MPRLSLVLVCAVVGAPSTLHAQCCLTFDSLSRQSCCVLERLYRDAAPGYIPIGNLRGRAVFCDDASLHKIRTRVSWLLWRGKSIDACMNSINHWLVGKAVKSCVYLGPSLLDGRPAIILDYRGTSHVWASARDEMREVAPGLYVGIMYLCEPCGARRKLMFVVQCR